MSVPVSNAWKTAISGQFRYPGYFRAILHVVPPGMQENAQVSSESTESITSLAGLLEPNEVATPPAATFETDRWLGDGSQYLLSETVAENEALCWWSNTVDLPVVLSLQFDSIYSIPGLRIEWDTETVSWPSSITLEGFTASHVSTGAVTRDDCNAVSQYFDVPFTDIMYLNITINAWNYAGWRARVNSILLGLYFKVDNEEIVESYTSLSASRISEELPQPQVSFTFKNLDGAFDPTLQSGYSKFLVAKQQVEIQWGFETSPNSIEWMTVWPMFLNSWKIPNDSSTVTLKATSRLSFMTDDYMYGVYDGAEHTFAAVAATMLEHSHVLVTAGETTPWTLDSELAAYTTSAPLPMVAENVVLQYIAGATGCVLDTDVLTDFIRLRSSTESTTYSITKNQTTETPAFTVSSQLKSITVQLYTYTPASTATTVYKGTIHIAGTKTLTVQYASSLAATNVTATVTGATLVSGTYYAHVAVLVVAAATGGADVQIEITGKILTQSTIDVVTYLNNDILAGQTVTVSNPLITNMDTANAVTSYLEQYYAMRNHVQISYLGYPELETGDIITISTDYGTSEAVVEKNTVEFNGGFLGTITVVPREV